ncbi:MAG: hypothetical protein AABX63_00540 [Nanoarchaeota archaeon]
MEKIWKDRHIKRYIYLLICTSGFLVFSYIFFDDIFNIELSLDYFSIIIILGFFFLLLMHTLRAKLNFVTKEGIRIGNAPDDSYEIFRLKQKPTVINWADIKVIKIFGREVRRILNSAIIDILTIRTKDNNKYESFIADPKGFVKVLKSLNKEHLLVKDSKYLNLLKNNKN